MDQIISLNPIQAEMIDRLSRERDVIIKRLDDLIIFALASQNIDPSSVLKTEIRGNDFIVTMKT